MTPTEATPDVPVVPGTDVAGVVDIAPAGTPERVFTAVRPEARAHGARFAGRRWVPGALAEAAARIDDGRMRAPTPVAYPLERAAQAMADGRAGVAGGRPVLMVAPR